MNQIKIAMGENLVSVFLQNGFFKFEKTNVGVHSHSFTEVHLILSGSTEFFIENNRFTLRENQVIIIPKNQKHFFNALEETVNSVAFQIDVPIKNPSFSFVSKNLANLIMEEIKKAESGNYSVVSGLLSSLCCEIFNEKYCGVAEKNTEFLIKEFFSHNYMLNVTISDLAEILHFSVRHTERVCRDVTGMTFKENITKERENASIYLQEHTHLPLTSVAEKVGYKSYAGYYKMINKKASKS